MIDVVFEFWFAWRDQFPRIIQSIGAKIADLGSRVAAALEKNVSFAAAALRRNDKAFIGLLVNELIRERAEAMFVEPVLALRVVLNSVKQSLIVRSPNRRAGSLDVLRQEL